MNVDMYRQEAERQFHYHIKYTLFNLFQTYIKIKSDLTKKCKVALSATIDKGVKWVFLITK